MSDDENRPRQIIPTNIGVLQDLANRVKLILRLMADSRVSLFLKTIPVAGLAYLFWPIDIPGPIDDAAIIWMSLYIFVELCPPDVVEEHKKAVYGVISAQATDVPSEPPAAPQNSIPEEDIIEGEYREVK